MARGLAAQLPHWHQALQPSICGREDYSPYFWRPDFFFFSRVGEEGSRKQASEVTVGLPVEGTPIQQSGAVERHQHPQRAGETTRISVDLETLRAVSHSKIYFYTYTLSRVESRAKWGRGGLFEGRYKHTVSAECFPKSTDV